MDRRTERSVKDSTEVNCRAPRFKTDKTDEGRGAWCSKGLGIIGRAKTIGPEPRGQLTRDLNRSTWLAG